MLYKIEGGREKAKLPLAMPFLGPGEGAFNCYLLDSIVHYLYHELILDGTTLVAQA